MTTSLQLPSTQSEPRVFCSLFAPFSYAELFIFNKFWSLFCKTGGYPKWYDHSRRGDSPDPWGNGLTEILNVKIWKLNLLR